MAERTEGSGCRPNEPRCRSRTPKTTCRFASSTPQSARVPEPTCTGATPTRTDLYRCASRDITLHRHPRPTTRTLRPRALGRQVTPAPEKCPPVPRCGVDVPQRAEHRTMWGYSGADGPQRAEHGTKWGYSGAGGACGVTAGLWDRWGYSRADWASAASGLSGVSGVSGRSGISGVAGGRR